MFKSVFKTATFKQSWTTITGTVLNGALGVLFYVVLARFLGPAEFGLLTISLTTLVLVADMADIGTNTGLVRFVSFNLVSNREKALKVLKLSLEIKLIAWLIVFSAIFLLAPFLAENIFHKPVLNLLLQLAGFGVGGALLFTFATSTLQAQQKYLSWSIVNIATNAIRLLVVLALGFLFVLNSVNSLMVYILLPFFGFFITLLILPTRDILKVKGEFNLLRELLRYNMPVAIFSMIAAFSARLDIYLNAALLPAREVGIYGAASQLVQIMPQVVSALGLVSSPKFASFTSNSQMMVYFKKFQLLVFGLCLLGLLSIPISVYLIPLLFGPAYAGAVIPFVILFLGQLIFLFSIPVHHSIIFYFSRPDVFIWVALGNLLIISALGYLLILSYGVMGAALTVLVGMIFNFLYPLGWLLVKLKKEKKDG